MSEDPKKLKKAIFNLAFDLFLIIDNYIFQKQSIKQTCYSSNFKKRDIT